MAITELKSAPDMSEAEWNIRCNLAALYRILHSLRMTDLVYTHMSARVPGENNRFLINRYGDLFDEITASSLVKMDMDGNVVGDPSRFNRAGFNIHSGVYLARPDVNCIMHTHTRAGIAVSASERGLLPISQHSLVVLNDLAYHDYGGPGTLEERDVVGHSCAKANNIIMRNHGLLALGETIPSAFKRMYYLEQSCQIQTAAVALNEPLVMIRDDVQQATFEMMEENQSAPDYGNFEWESLLRMLDRQGAEYRK
ncbi:MAG TPA: class II aldolase/adducin family protein [Gammaproteobacteria bacterium]|nr:class II aldolase/adducin family protein [Gammaproteobacteria bacterium]